MLCSIGQEPAPAFKGGLGWTIPVGDPSHCTQIEIGGMNSQAPHRPSKVSPQDSFVHGDDPDEIRAWLISTGKLRTSTRQEGQSVVNM